MVYEKVAKMTQLRHAILENSWLSLPAFANQQEGVMSEAAHSSNYMTRSSEEVMHPSGWALFPTEGFCDGGPQPPAREPSREGVGEGGKG